MLQQQNVLVSVLVIVNQNNIDVSFTIATNSCTCTRVQPLKHCIIILRATLHLQTLFIIIISCTAIINQRQISSFKRATLHSQTLYHCLFIPFQFKCSHPKPKTDITVLIISYGDNNSVWLFCSQAIV